MTHDPDIVILHFEPTTAIEDHLASPAEISSGNAVLTIIVNCTREHGDVGFVLVDINALMLMHTVIEVIPPLGAD